MSTNPEGKAESSLMTPLLTRATTQALPAASAGFDPEKFDLTILTRSVHYVAGNGWGGGNFNTRNVWVGDKLAHLNDNNFGAIAEWKIPKTDHFTVGVTGFVNSFDQKTIAAGISYLHPISSPSFAHVSLGARIAVEHGYTKQELAVPLIAGAVADVKLKHIPTITFEILPSIDGYLGETTVGVKFPVNFHRQSASERPAMIKALEGAKLALC